MVRLVKTLLLALGMIWCTVSLASDEVAKANQLISEGKVQEAFELLEPLEFDLSGDETFDLLFGYAALEAGHISLSTLAFERVLAVNPDNNTARFHLARAYFVLNDYDGARREFEMLLSMNPTDGLRETVGQYLDAIKAREPAAKTTISGYVSLALGSDSNVNGGVTDPVNLPELGDSFLYPTDGDDLETKDTFANLVAGFDVLHKFDEARNVYFGGNYNQRNNDDRDDQDYALTGLQGGYQHAVGNHSYRAGLNLSNMNSDGEHYLDTTGIDLEWRNTLGQRTQIGLVARLSETRYAEEENEGSDYNDSSLSFSTLRILGEEGKAILSGAIEIGNEKSLNNRLDGDLAYSRLSITGQYQFADDLSGFILMAQKNKDYNNVNIYYNEKRSDAQTSIVGGLVYKFIKSWSLRLNATMIETDSNLDLYSTDKKSVSLAIRKDFL